MRRPDFSTLTGRRVLITGAASGIGRATAIKAAAKGATVYLTDRNAADLAAVADEIKTAGGAVGIAHPADVSNAADVAKLAAAVHADGGPVDIVMNIAGIATWGTVDRLTVEQWRRTVDVNLMGPIHIIDAFVGPMITAQRGGHLVNVSSAAGLLGLPWHAPYSATKFGLRGVSEVLRFDLRPHGIGVSLVCPGGVATNLTSTVDIAGVNTHDGAFAKVRHRFERRAKSPEQAAAAILRGIRRNTYMVYTSRDIQAAYLLQRVFPPGYNLLMRGMNLAMRRILKPS